jgi:hypothetical protein
MHPRTDEIEPEVKFLTPAPSERYVAPESNVVSVQVPVGALRKTPLSPCDVHPTDAAASPGAPMSVVTTATCRLSGVGDPCRNEKKLESSVTDLVWMSLVDAQSSITNRMSTFGLTLSCSLRVSVVVPEFPPAPPAPPLPPPASVPL